MVGSTDSWFSLLPAVFEAKADTKDGADGLLRKNKNTIPGMIMKAMTW
jgi:hypothetical protein